MQNQQLGPARKQRLASWPVHAQKDRGRRTKVGAARGTVAHKEHGVGHGDADTLQVKVLVRERAQRLVHLVVAPARQLEHVAEHFHYLFAKRVRLRFTV